MFLNRCLSPGGEIAKEGGGRALKGIGTDRKGKFAKGVFDEEDR